MAKFKLGQLVMTRAINDRVADDTPFAKHVTESLRRYTSCDWGDTCAEDAEMNNDAVKNGDRILAAYGTGDDKIWIITEWDRSVTTILYPSEY
jgi:hypothetical protein